MRLTSSFSGLPFTCTICWPRKLRLTCSMASTRTTRRAMDLPELLRVELVDQLLDRLADQRLEGRRSARACTCPRRERTGCRRSGSSGGWRPRWPAPSAGIRAARHRRRRAAAIACASRSSIGSGACASRARSRSQVTRQPLRLGRLQHVVDRALLERADRVLVVRGDEDDVGAAGERPRRLDAVHPGHADVEKDDVGLEALRRSPPPRGRWRPRRRSAARATRPSGAR